MWDVLEHKLRVLIGEAVGWGSPIGCASAAVDFPPLASAPALPPPALPPPSKQGASGRHSGGELEPRAVGGGGGSEVGGCMCGLQASTAAYTLAVDAGAGEWGGGWGWGWVGERVCRHVCLCVHTLKDVRVGTYVRAWRTCMRKPSLARLVALVQGYSEFVREGLQVSSAAHAMPVGPLLCPYRHSDRWHSFAPTPAAAGRCREPREQ